MLKSLFLYRYFILSSVKNEFKARFARSKLGAIWMILNPLAQVLIYALILSAVLKAKLPGIDSQYAYAIYLISGMLAWSLFFDITSRSLNIFIDNANLIKKVAFPKITLPLILIGSSMINFFLLFICSVGIFIILGHISLDYISWLPILVIITLIMAIGIGLFLGIINVFIRDVGQIMSIVLQFWFWLTPVVYSLSMMPEKYHQYILLNPMAGIVVCYQNILAYNKPPEIDLLIYPTCIGITMIGLSLYLYKKANEDMADVL